MSEHLRNNGEPWRRRLRLVLIGFALIGGFFLVAEHQAHVLPWLPWLLLAACLLMHVFMHHGNGGHDQHGDSGGPDARSSASPRPGSAAPPGPGNGGPGPSQHQHQDRS